MMKIELKTIEIVDSVEFDDLSDREKSIYYAAYGNGWDEAVKIMFFVIISIVILFSILIYIKFKIN